MPGGRVTVLPELLVNDVAVVTGAAQGNGAAIARGLAACGATVAVADVNRAGAERVAGEIVDAGGTAASFVLDVTDRSACVAFAAAVEAQLGSVSILVNNAGITRRTPPGSDDFLKNLDAQFAVNVAGSANMAHALLQQLRRTRGRVVNIASIASFVAYRGSAAYAASKGAVKQLTKGLASDLAAEGIRVNAVAPGVIATPMTEVTRADPEAVGRFLAHTPMGRVGEPEELVGPVIFLASSLSTYVTGAVLPVDGGYLAV